MGKKTVWVGTFFLKCFFPSISISNAEYFYLSQIVSHMFLCVGHNLRYQILKICPCTYKHMIYTQKAITQASGPLEIIRRDDCYLTIFRSKNKCNQNINMHKNLVKKVPLKSHLIIIIIKIALRSIYILFSLSNLQIHFYSTDLAYTIHIYLQLQS